MHATRRPPKMILKLGKMKKWSRMCDGCQELEKVCLARAYAIKKLGAPKDKTRMDKCVIHNNFTELDRSAQAGCFSCRIFRQALLLACTDADDLFNPESEISKQPVTIACPKTRPESGSNTVVAEVLPSIGLSLKIVAADGSRSGKKASLVGSNDSSLMAMPLKWITACRSTHIGCDGLKVSHKNPNRLIEILAPGSFRLVSVSESRLVEYCALSYCWGTQTGENPAITTKANIADREKGFDLEQLTPTLRDATSLVSSLGMKYVWIDAITIVQDDYLTKQGELAKMHEIYGNALVTISVASNSSQTQSLFSVREAFTLHTTTCEVGGWTVEPAQFGHLNIQHMRANSPLAERGWTLQEEVLSPRVLYWSRKGMFWSCSHCTKSELDPSIEERPIQEFLQVSRNEPQSPKLYALWQGLVIDYAQRYLSNAEDRMPALLGVASTYAFATGQSLEHDYFFGLWRHSLIQDLQWYVLGNPPSKGADHTKMAPSWSWASLPFGAKISLNKGHKTSSNDVRFIRYEATSDNPVESSRIIVEGRHRPLLSPLAEKMEWADPTFDSERKAHFNYLPPNLFVYTMNTTQGVIVVSYPFKPKIICHLDVVPISIGPPLYAIQMSSQKMLIVEKVEDHPLTYRRVGFADIPNWDLFKESETEEIAII